MGKLMIGFNGRSIFYFRRQMNESSFALYNYLKRTYFSGVMAAARGNAKSTQSLYAEQELLLERFLAHSFIKRMANGAQLTMADWERELNELRDFIDSLQSP